MKHQGLGRLLLWFVLGGAIAGAAGVWLVESSYSDLPPLHRRDFRVERARDQPLKVTDERSVSIPFPFGDFDLFAEVSLTPGAEFDLVARRVEPRVDTEPFHGRWVAFRLTTNRDGPPVVTREQALLDGLEGGQTVIPDRPATIVMNGRGRTLRVNLAGIWHEIDATDAHGGFMLIARNGEVTVSMLEVNPVARASVLLPFAWGGLLGGLLGALLALFRPRPVRAVVALVLTPVGGWLASMFVTPHALPLVEPETLAVLLLGLSSAPLAFLIATGGRLRMAVGGVVGLALLSAALECGVRIEASRLRPLEDPRLHGFLGWGAGSAGCDRLAYRFSSRTAIHVPRPHERRVIFIGGEPLWDGLDKGRGYAYRAGATARQAAGGPVDVVVMPSTWGDVRQQVDLLLSGYLPRYAPKAIVVAVPPWAEDDSDWPVARVGEVPAELGASTLLGLWERSSAQSPGANPEAVVATLERLREAADGIGVTLIVMTPLEVVGPMREAVEGFAKQSGVAFVAADITRGDEASVAKLADLLGPALAR